MRTAGAPSTGRNVIVTETQLSRPSNVAYSRTYTEADVRYTPTADNPTGTSNNGYTRRL